MSSGDEEQPDVRRDTTDAGSRPKAPEPASSGDQAAAPEGAPAAAETETKGVETVSIAQIVDRAAASGGDVTPVLVRIGFRLTIALLILIVLVFVWVGIYAATTSPPTLSNVKEFFPGDTAKAFDSYERLRTSWMNGIKDLLQLLIVSLLVPLVATVIGYIFGRREAQDDAEG